MELQDKAEISSKDVSNSDNKDVLNSKEGRTATRDNVPNLTEDQEETLPSEDTSAALSYSSHNLMHYFKLRRL